MISTIWKNALRSRGPPNVNPLETSTSYSGIKNDVFIEKKLKELLFDPYYLPQKRLMKFMGDIDNKKHPYHLFYTKTDTRKQILKEIGAGETIHGRSAPERFIKGVVELVTGGKYPVILDKKIENKSVDIYIQKAKIVIEVQGFDWHYKDNMKIVADTKRANELLDLECVNDLYFIIPPSNMTSTLSDRYKNLIKTLTEISLYFNSKDTTKFLGKQYENRKITITNQEIINKAKLLCNECPDYDF